MKELRQFTMARVGLGRAGNSLPVRELLDFQLAHARARDAVHFQFDAHSLAEEVSAIVVKSAARDRVEYLRRPDLGRRLSADSRKRLEELHGEFDAALIMADGLSPLAVHRHAVELLRALSPRLRDWKLAPMVIAEQGRVALGDEIGSVLGASLAVVMIGERPGLTSPDSLGIYVTWSPRPGRTDAERNCISNIHGAGLSIGAAAELLLLLMNESRTRRISGVNLRVDAGRALWPARERI
jgi:ethanolamine ammonia-lyase small subunit